MAMVPLMKIASARSGDKGDSSNIGVLAKSHEIYGFLEQTLTAELVKERFAAICHGSVTRYELPNIQSLNFILEHSLGGGGAETLITDAQGKVHGLAMLHIELDVPDALLETVARH